MFIELLIIALLAAWLGVSAVYQCYLHQLKPWTARFDRFRIIPGWRFFATPPFDHDFECRYESSDGTLGIWKSINDFQPRRLLTAVWNPRFMVQDLVITWADEVSELTKKSASLPERVMLNNFSYRALCHSLKWFAPSGAVRGQFRIVERPFDDAEDSVLYISPLQPITEQNRTVGEMIVAMPHQQSLRQAS